MVDHGIVCRKCSKSGRVAFSWQMRADQVPVIRVECLRCERFIQWAARTPGHMELADKKAGHDVGREASLFPDETNVLRNGRNA